MRLVNEADYLTFLSGQQTVSVGRSEIRLLGHQRPRKLQPDDFKTETTTLWSFPQRGRWATHRASYRGNWAPQIVRNLILRYSNPGDTILDQMVGGGTTLVECRLTGRNAIGVDVNRDALMLTMDRLNFSGTVLEPLPLVDIRLYHGDARNLNLVPDASIDLIATHPPYANIIRYTTPSQGQTTPAHPEPVEGGERQSVPLVWFDKLTTSGGVDQSARSELVKPQAAHMSGDLSKMRSIEAFVAQMRLVADECCRVLKPDHYCAILVGDTRRSKHYTPIAFRVMQAFLDAGFILKEDIIKAQWNTQTEGLWANLSRNKNFLLIMHEHLFVFRKPASDEKTRPFRESMRWWEA